MQPPTTAQAVDRLPDESPFNEEEAAAVTARLDAWYGDLPDTDGSRVQLVIELPRYMGATGLAAEAPGDLVRWCDAFIDRQAWRLGVRVVAAEVIG